jgi:hypothetical protein
MLSRACHRLEDAAIAGELYTVLGRYDEADGHFADAVERQDCMGAKGTVVHTRLAWAAMLLRRNASEDTRRARTLLQEARAGAQEVSIPRVEERIDRMLALAR